MNDQISDTRFARQLERELAVMKLQRNELLAALTAILPFCEEDESELSITEDYRTAIRNVRAAIAKVKEGK